jgi:AhpD family alkylhydroperoxidase
MRYSVSSKSFDTITRDLSKALAVLRRENTETMKGFSQLASNAMKAGALSELDKELIALAIGVTQRCDGCLGYHVKALIRLGVTREQFMEALGVCTYMGGGPALMYAAEAVRAYEEFTATPPAPQSAST